MKKTLLLPIIILLVVLPLVLSDTAINPTINTGTAYGLNKNSFFSFFPTQTVVGGFRCNDKIDVQYRMTTNGQPHPIGESCFVDSRNSYIIVWKWNPWNKVDEFGIVKGQGTICKSYPFEYDYAYYYCDTSQETCRETSPYATIGCGKSPCLADQLLRQRQVQELSSGGCSNWQINYCANPSDYGITCQPNCEPKKTPACNPSTKEIKQFSSSCIDAGFVTDLSQCAGGYCTSDAQCKTDHSIQGCIDFSDKISGFGYGCNKDNCPLSGCSGGGSSGDDFILSNLKYVKPSDIPYSVYFLSGASNDQAIAAKFGLGQIFSVDVKNIGTKPLGGRLEGFYISQNNPYLQNFIQHLGGSANIPLFSAFLKREGLGLIELATCVGERGATYQVDTIYPQVSKTLWLYVPYPKDGDKLSGKDNYDSGKQYLLVIDIIDKCDNANVYDIIGGTVNGFKISPQQKQGSNYVPDVVPPIDINQTPYNSTARQVTVSKEDISKLTSVELIKSSCSDSTMCDSGAVCQSLDSLAQEGTITPTLAQQRADETYIFFDKAVAGGGAALAGYGSFAGASAALIGSAQAVGAGGTPILYTLCTAFGFASAGVGFPVCLGVATIGGAVAGGYLTAKVVNFFHDVSQKDIKSVGYCVPKESSSSFSWDKLVTNIGKGVNEAFGGQAKTGLTNSTMGYIVIIVVGILLLMFLSKIIGK